MICPPFFHAECRTERHGQTLYRLINGDALEPAWENGGCHLDSRVDKGVNMKRARHNRLEIEMDAAPSLKYNTKVRRACCLFWYTYMTPIWHEYVSVASNNKDYTFWRFCWGRERERKERTSHASCARYSTQPEYLQILGPRDPRLRWARKCSTKKNGP